MKITTLALLSVTAVALLTISLSRVHDDFTSFVEQKGMAVPITPELVNDPVRAMETYNFHNADLDKLISFDPEGYAALGTTDAEDWTREYKAFMVTFRTWTHTTQHALYLARFDKPYVCAVEVPCTSR